MSVSESKACPTCKRPFTKARSNPQNRYLWGVVYQLLSDHTGYTIEEMHEICKHKFLRDWVLIAKEQIEITRSTTSLSVIEMSEYTEHIRSWASAHLSVNIPDPGKEN